MSVKSGFIIGEIIRTRRLCYRTKDFINQLIFFFCKLYRRGYSSKFIKHTWKLFISKNPQINKDRSSITNVKNNQNNHMTEKEFDQIISTPFTEIINQTELKKLIQNTIQLQPKGSRNPHPLNNLRIVWKRNQNFFSYIKKIEKK